MTIPGSIFTSGGSLVDVDATILIQLGIFLFLFIVLRSLLFKPIIRLLEARHQATESRREEAARLEVKATDLNEKISVQITEIRSSASKDRLGEEEKAGQAHRELLIRTREECMKLAQETRDDLEKQAGQVRAQLPLSAAPRNSSHGEPSPVELT